MSTQLYTNARIFTSDTRRWAEAMLVQGERILYVGDADTAQRLRPDAERIDLAGRLVVPGFVDGHAHVLGTGEALGQVSLWGAKSVEEIQQRITAWDTERPAAARVLATGWLHGAIPGSVPDAGMLDAAVPGKPVYAFAYDFHSVWVNTAALAELGITADTQNPLGGTIKRNAAGHATGYIDENAFYDIVLPFLDSQVSENEHGASIAAVQRAYRETGVTTACDMGFNETDLESFKRADKDGSLTSRLIAYWRVNNTGSAEDNIAQVQRAAELAAEHPSPFLRVVGIKVIIDGTIDGCTATLGSPYADGSNAAPIWSLEELAPVVAAADAAGLKVAMHAIGDESVRIAIGAVEHAVAQNGPRERRHRIEHLELVDRADVDRLASLGITASMQPVHADPAISANWRAKLDDDRVERGFPWPWMTDAGARLAFGTDSPTSPHAPLPNMYVAATRASALDPTAAANVPDFALPLAHAIEHATRDSAWTCGAEHEIGRLAAGLYADFVVLDTDVLAAASPTALLGTEVLRTVVGGRTVYDGRHAERETSPH
ncbi:putative hydrolase [Arthrobacter globiformis NBRC 12137]|uniref:Putative hydrolase n=1 Tax=Arthrobacter globiformis (strain ATCC 8010 / DSM 20124 / JCM 1332 / NBRC 12137 / NCIMB 8907 / NRRL B-2979 / 168) TaxID=1077972 RepID=H0QJU4_ARTG1|nr:amidohydrolase [Arthrobacter globiformis]GAB13095.1 putative hydrolase [Arthrobacter globiformis NBRC 12137]